MTGPGVRVWVERTAGHTDNQTAGARHFPGMAHAFEDRTDRPCAALRAHVANVAIERWGEPLRIWQEQNFSAASTSANVGTVFPGMAMPFEDRTDLPSLTIRNHVKSMIIERGGATVPAPLPLPERPPYRVLTMDEIRAMEPNGFDAVSTFSGCGGSSTGYRMAGFRMLWVSEFVEAARDTYRANAAPHTPPRRAGHPGGHRRGDPRRDREGPRRARPVRRVPAVRVVLHRRLPPAGLGEGQDLLRHGAALGRSVLRVRPPDRRGPAPHVRR